MLMPEEPSLQKNFDKRGKAYREAMLVIFNYLADEEWQKGKKKNSFSVKVKINTFYENYRKVIEKISCFEDGKAFFDRLFAEYCEILAKQTLFKFKDCPQELCIAEQFWVWKEGREPFTSEFSIPDEQRNKTLKIIQSEDPRVDSEILQQEYSQLDSQTSLSSLFWFNELPSLWQKNFIRKNKDELVKQSIPSSLRCVPGLANLAKHTCMIGVEKSSYFRHATQLAINLLLKAQTEDEQFRLTCLNQAIQIRLSIEDKLKSNSNANEVVILSQSIVSPGFPATFKSRWFSNKSDNDTKIYEMKERVIELFQRALAMPDEPINAIDNKLIKNFFLNQDNQAASLKYKDFLAKYGLEAQFGRCFKHKKYKPIKIILLSTNHPYNILRHVAVYSDQTERNNVNIALLFVVVGRHLAAFQRMFQSERERPPQQFPQFLNYLEQSNFADLDNFNSKFNKLLISLNEFELKKMISANSSKNIIEILGKVLSNSKAKDLLGENNFRLIDALQALLSTPIGQGVLADKRHRQMLISIYEATILYCIGGTLWVACKSGKDRTGGASAAYDAATTFCQLQGKLPRNDDTKSDRELFLNLYTYFLASGHQQKAAAQNAPGAHGLVKSNLFAPSDMPLDRKNIHSETQFARLNKPKLKKRKAEHQFDLRIFEGELQKLVKYNNLIHLDKDTVLAYWYKSWGHYSIGGISIKELRKDKNFEDIMDLSKFIKDTLLNKIQDEGLRRYYLALILSSFHQAGFQHAFSFLTAKKMQNFDLPTHPTTIEINFTPLENGVQIEELNTYRTADDPELEDNGEYHFQTNSSISVILTKGANAVTEGYKLDVIINDADVDCNSELSKALFFKKRSLYERIIDFFISLIDRIRSYLDSLGTKKLAKEQLGKVEILDESWLAKAEVNTGIERRNEQTTQVVENNEQKGSAQHALLLQTPASFSISTEPVILDMIWKNLINLAKGFLPLKPGAELCSIFGVFRPLPALKVVKDDDKLSSNSLANQFVSSK